MSEFLFRLYFVVALLLHQADLVSCSVGYLVAVVVAPNSLSWRAARHKIVNTSDRSFDRLYQCNAE